MITMVKLKVGTRELEQIGENIHEKFRSQGMKNGKGERVMIENGILLKLKDEKLLRIEITKRLEG